MGSSSSNTLVVFYSRTGHTRRVARAIAERAGWDLEEIREPSGRRGLRGYLRSGFEAVTQRMPPILPIERPLDAYGLVVVGTPIWHASLASPVRRFLVQNRGKLRDVAFFLTCGSSGSKRVFQQMEEAALRTPVATLAIRAHQLRGDLAAQVRAFIEAAESWTARDPTAGTPVSGAAAGTPVPAGASR